ncbi:MAG: 4Fe-4S dicluster domain-containing protein [Candidatus Stahlbacteria bacterium]|nr:4Fe-4S dicluster domain-containing protein [Candidatus Stahlbacteria bacterium]
MVKVFPNGMKVACGEAHIINDRCKGCGFCVTYCPMDVLELSKEFNPKGYHFPVVKNLENCINCNLCGVICPEFAIWSTLREEIEVTEVTL